MEPIRLSRPRYIAPFRVAILMASTEKTPLRRATRSRAGRRSLGLRLPRGRVGAGEEQTSCGYEGAFEFHIAPEEKAWVFLMGRPGCRALSEEEEYFAPPGSLRHCLLTNWRAAATHIVFKHWQRGGDGS